MNQDHFDLLMSWMTFVKNSLLESALFSRSGYHSVAKIRPHSVSGALISLGTTTRHPPKRTGLRSNESVSFSVFKLASSVLALC